MLVSKALLSTLSAASKDDTRPLLTCLRVYKEKDHIVSVATDGYILAEVIETTPGDEEFPNLPVDDHSLGEADSVLVPAETAKKMISSMKKNDTGLPVLSYAALTSASLTTTDLATTTMLHFRSPEGNYPEYRELIDREEKKAYNTVKINPKYLKQLLAMFKDDLDIEISVSNDKHAPVFIRSEEYGVKKTALVMPLKA